MEQKQLQLALPNCVAASLRDARLLASQAEQEAIATVLAYGRTHGCERGLFVVGDKVLADSKGNADSVRFSSEQLDVFAAHPEGVMIHNHPDICASLSGQDIHMATGNGIRVAAVTEDGGIYHTNKGIRIDDKRVEHAFEARQADMLDQNVLVKLRRLEWQGHLSRNEAVIAHAHLRNVAFKREGWVDYDAEIGTITRDTLERLKKLVLEEQHLLRGV